MTSDSRRLAILTAREINELYGLPCFTDQERCIYFDLNSAEHDAVDAVHTDAAAVHMVLQLGYFKAKRQFFNFYRFGALGIFYQYLLPAAVIKFGGPAVGVASDSLSGFKSAVIFQKIRACRPE